MHDDLAALRIDRSSRPPTGRGKLWLGLGALLIILGVGGAALQHWVLDPKPSVTVATARQVGRGGESLTRVVLAGSGYVVTADRYVSLGARVAGRIEEYLVEEGQTVKAGESLVRLDARPFQASLRRSQANLALAHANAQLRTKELARLSELRERDVSSQAALDVKENQLRVAEAQIARDEAEIDQIRLDIEDTVLRAPSDGVILEKLKEVGEIAVPGGFAGSGELIRLANLAELRAEVDVSETDLAKVRAGQNAEVVPDAYPERSYSALVVKLAPQMNRQKGTLEVQLRILEPDAWLRPDMSVRVSFLDEVGKGDRGSGRLLVVAPAEALRRDASGAFVWVVSKGSLRRQPVVSSGSVGSDVAIESGLLGGEKLVVGPDEGLEEGQMVAIEAQR